MSFNSQPYPSYTEAQVASNLPTSGNFLFFYNLDKDSDLYIADSGGNLTFVSDEDDDCCTCEISSSWLCALNKALNNGLMTASQYIQAIAVGIKITSVNTGSGNCSLSITVNKTPPTSVVISSSSSSLSSSGTLQLGISASPAGSDPSVLWVSSDTSKATVDQTGLVTGVAAGSVTITAYSTYDSEVNDEIALTVT